MRNLLSKEDCRLAVKLAEEKRGREFRVAGYVRSDDYFVTDLPPLELFEMPGVYVPEGDDWGGVNDRQAWGDRDNMMRYWARYSYLPGLTDSVAE